MGSAYPTNHLLGLIGAPIAHSASPAMHEAAGEALGMRCRYHLIEVAGANARSVAHDARRRPDADLFRRQRHLSL